MVVIVVCEQWYSCNESRVMSNKDVAVFSRWLLLFARNRASVISLRESNDEDKEKIKLPLYFLQSRTVVTSTATTKTNPTQPPMIGIHGNPSGRSRKSTNNMKNT